MSTSLAQFMTGSRVLSDTVNDGHITDSDLTFWINQSAYRLYDILIEKGQSDYFTLVSGTLTTDGTNQQYAVPMTDFYKGFGVDYRVGNPGQSPSLAWLSMPTFAKPDRNRYTFPNYITPYGMMNVRYRFLGPFSGSANSIFFSPTPMAGASVRFWYAPTMVPMTGAADTFNGVNGWDEFIYTDVAIKILLKQERDASGQMARMMAIEKHIEEIAEARNMGDGETVAETQPDGFWQWAGGPYGIHNY